MKLANTLQAIRGQFAPEQLGARLFMSSEDLESPENILIWFHERFHYLQSVFTPYGQLKWGAYRTGSSDIIDTWLGLTKKFAVQRCIPIADYLSKNSKAHLQVAYNTWINTVKYEIYGLVEKGSCMNRNELFHTFDGIPICPTIQLFDGEHHLRGIDVLESFAKYEEALLAELILQKSIDETIDPTKLNPEYYSALYYFVEEVGAERLLEFPIVCELSLATPHIPSPVDTEKFYNNAPNWRFIKLIDAIKDSRVLPPIDIFDNDSFYKYANMVLKRCEFSDTDAMWDSCITYLDMTDLSMAQEMKAAIEYKKANPWILTYPMRDPNEFLSSEFARFEPYFTIVEDGIHYSKNGVSPDELLFENHIQAFAKQICGQMSKYCMYSDMLMCGYSYMGLKDCPHMLDGKCDGHICSESELLDYELDTYGNLCYGCSFEMVLNILGTSVKEIKVGDINTSLVFEQLRSTTEAIKRSGENTD